MLIRYSSVSDYVWSIILSDRLGPSFSKTLRAHFPDGDDYLEDLHLSRLHSIVLGLIPGKLEGELVQSGIEINATDSRGKTALTWAVQRRDHFATRLLLKYKADLSIANIQGISPIQFAAFEYDDIGLKLLLEAGASLTQK